MIFERCIHCPRIAKDCAGPNLSIAKFADQMEWVEEYQRVHNISDTDISRRSPLPKGTIAGIKSGHRKDIRTDTMRMILMALYGLTVEEYDALAYLPCLDFDDEDRAALEEKLAASDVKLSDMEHLHADDRTKIDHLKKQVETNESVLQDHREYIRRKDRVIRILAVALSVSLLILLKMLLWDYFNRGIGFFWRDAVIRWSKGVISSPDIAL